MIDEFGLYVDKSGDGGDSCNFTCCGILLGRYDDLPDVKRNAVNLFWNGGYPVRHPKQVPWNNSKNFTRDQAIPLMHVLDPDRIKTFLKRNPTFFPNFERDAVGSAKVPWPHRHWKDSRPHERNLPVWGHIEAPPNCELEFKWFDYADLMTPDFKAMALTLAGEPLSWFQLKLARSLCGASIEQHIEKAKGDRSFTDFKQLYLTAKPLGLHREFAAAHPWGLYYAAEDYFDKQRQLPDLAEAFYREFKKEGITE